MDKLNKNTVADCYTIVAEDIAEGYAEFLRVNMRLSEEEVKDQFNSAFYVWSKFNSYLFWDLMFADNVVDKILKGFLYLKKADSEKIYKNMMQFREWLLAWVTNKKKLEDEIHYRQQEFFQDMYNAMQVLHISEKDKHVNWALCLHHALKVMVRTDDYDTARKIFKYFIFAVKNHHAIDLYLQKRIAPIKPVSNFDGRDMVWLPQSSTKDIHYILDQFMDEDQAFYIVSRRDVKMVSCFKEQGRSTFIHTKFSKLHVKYRIVLSACEIMLHNNWVAIKVKYNKRQRHFTIKAKTTAFTATQVGKYKIEVKSASNEMIGTITYGPTDVKYQLVKIEVNPKYKKSEDILFAIGFSVLYLRKKNARIGNNIFPYVYFPKWSELKD